MVGVTNNCSETALTPSQRKGSDFAGSKLAFFTVSFAWKRMPLPGRRFDARKQLKNWHRRLEDAG